MGQLQLGGTLTAGPPEGVGGGFPGMQAIIPLLFGQATTGLAYNVATGVLTRNVLVNSPSWGTLSGVGPSDTVTKGSFLYFKAGSPMKIRITTDDGSGGDVLAIIPVDGGPLLIPFPSVNFLKLLEVQGQGQVEYFVCGLQ